jgi:hypothetical protein
MATASISPLVRCIRQFAASSAASDDKQLTEWSVSELFPHDKSKP